MKAFIFDTETTGLTLPSNAELAAQPRVIEFYGVLIDHKKKAPLETLEGLYSPGHRLAPKITKITGIRDGDLDGKPKFRTLLPELERVLLLADRVVAHNLTFDMAVLDYEATRADLSLSWPAELICTVEATEYVTGFRLNLGALYERLFAEPMPNAHRAGADVTALVRVYRQLVKNGDV